jgi:hypothetical protein
MDPLAETDFLRELSGEVFLSQYAASRELDPSVFSQTSEGGTPPRELVKLETSGR